MSSLVSATVTARMDEPCIRVVERNGRTPDGKRLRRFQDVWVMRAQGPAVCVLDLGPARTFKCDEFQIIGGFTDPVTKRVYIEETVGSLVDAADQHRKELSRTRDMLPRDLLGDLTRFLEQRRDARVGRARFSMTAGGKS